jgi:hypothetical protein
MTTMTFLERVRRAVERVEAAFHVVRGSSLKKFPPLVFCPVCQRRTHWIEQGHVWGCPAGHRFSVDYHAGPPPRLPGDEGDNSKGEI